jgi:arylformamidase
MWPTMTEITDWDDAYTNVTYIPDGTAYPAHWASAAANFRNNLPAGVTLKRDVRYGPRERNTLDLFAPQNPRGLFVFVHGGYWMRFHKDDWSHLANGALANGWAAALPAYTLTPHISITGVTAEITTAIMHAASHIAGPIILAGHSAGGHLVTRVTCTDTSLPPDVQNRITRVISISGLHDLRPLLKTKMNETFQMTEAEAAAQSSALHHPLPNIQYSAWVGANERPEFIRQSRLLGEAWSTSAPRVEKNRHHFNVIDDLADSQSELCRSLAKPLIAPDQTSQTHSEPV